MIPNPINPIFIIPSIFLYLIASNRLLSVKNKNSRLKLLFSLLRRVIELHLKSILKLMLLSDIDCLT